MPLVLMEAVGKAGRQREGRWNCIHLPRASQPVSGLADAVMLQLGFSLASFLSGLKLVIHFF